MRTAAEWPDAMGGPQNGPCAPEEASTSATPRERGEDPSTVAGEEEVPDGHVKIPLLALSGNEIERVLAKSQDTWQRVAAKIADRHPTLCPMPPPNARKCVAEDFSAGVQVLVRSIAFRVSHLM